MTDYRSTDRGYFDSENGALLTEAYNLGTDYSGYRHSDKGLFNPVTGALVVEGAGDVSGLTDLGITETAAQVNAAVLSTAMTGLAKEYSLMSPPPTLPDGCWGKWDFTNLNYLSSLALTGCTFTHATLTLTKTAAFTNYVYTPGDSIYITGGTAVIPGTYVVTSRTSADAIVLAADITSNASGPSDVTTAGTAVNQNRWNMRSVVGSAFVGTTTTCAVTWTNHGFVTGDIINVSGITTLTAANGQFVVTVDNANAFHYTMLASQSATGAGTANVWKQVNFTFSTAGGGTITVVSNPAAGVPGVTFYGPSGGASDGAAATTPNIPEVPLQGPWTMFVVGCPWNGAGNSGFYGFASSNVIKQVEVGGIPDSRNAGGSLNAINMRYPLHYFDTMTVLKANQSYLSFNDLYLVNQAPTSTGHLELMKDGIYYIQGTYRISYVLFWHRELSEREIYSVWGWLTETLAPKRIDISTSRPPLTKIISPVNNSGGQLTKPYMGWASFGYWTWSSNANTVKATADAMIALGLDKLGYTYLLEDAVWYPQSISYRDAAGNPKLNPYLFPAGYKDVSTYLHAKGLKFGAYTVAYFHVNPGASLTDTYHYFIGSEGRELQDAQWLADAGVDFLKDDAWIIDPTQSEAYQRLDIWGPNAIAEAYSLMQQALVSTGRPIVLNGANGPYGTRSAAVIRSVGVSSARINTDFSVADAGYPIWTLSSVAWDHVALTLTKTGQFSTYVPLAGDFVRITGGTGITAGLYFIDATYAANANSIRLLSSCGGSNAADVTISGDPRGGIGCTVGTWAGVEKQFGMYDASVVSSYPFNDNIVQASWTGPTNGYFPDPDNLCLPNYSGGVANASGMTDLEGRTLFSYWCMLGAPLMLGIDLTTLKKTDPTYTTITNSALIAIDQDLLCWQALRVKTTAGTAKPYEVWAKPLAGGSWAIGFFNRDSGSHTMTLTWSEFSTAVAAAIAYPATNVYVDANIANYPAFANAQPTTVGSDLSGNGYAVTSNATTLTVTGIASHGCAVVILTP